MDEHSKEYDVDTRIITPKVVNPYANSNIRIMEEADVPSIRVMKRMEEPRNNFKKRGYKRNSKSKNTQMCKTCLKINHCITYPDTIFNNIAKQQMCGRFLESSENSQAVKYDFYRYKKDRKDKALNAKTTSKLDGIIRNVENTGHDKEEFEPIIHLASAMAIDSDSNDDSDSDSYEWHGQMEDRMTPAISILTDKPPPEPLPSLEPKLPSDDNYKIYQWIEDATNSAKLMLHHIATHHANTLIKTSYTP